MTASRQRKSPRVIRFVGLVVAAAAVGLIAVIPFRVEGAASGMFLLASLAALGGAAPVRIPALKTAVSATDPFVFTALAALGPLPACVVAAAGVVGAGARRAPRNTWLQFAFNLGNVVFSTAVASFTFLFVGGVPGGEIIEVLWPLVVATTVYFLTNTILVSGVIVIDTGAGFVTTWRESGLWTAVPAFAGLTLAAGLLLVLREIGTLGLALGIPPCWLLAAFYRNHKDRQEEQQSRIDQIEELNQQLEEKVAERTVELQQALTRIEDANVQLRQTNASLKAANRAKSEFLANVSHELRTPLNAIIGFSDLLGDDGFGALNEQQSEFVSDIHESGEHLLNLINDILDLSKIEAGRMELHRDRFELSGAVRDAVAMVRPQAGAKRIAIDLQIADDVNTVELDPGMLRQTLLNLLSNAVKFTPDEGRVVVFARRLAEELELGVRDTGIGISAENQQRIFDEFYQVDGSYSRNYEGTGLGLALVRRMVEMHGGSIVVDSTPGQGSCFVCRYPPGVLVDDARSAEPHRSGADEPEALVAASGRTILLVEDNPVNRKLARSVLRRSGHRVVEQPSGEDALAWLAEEIPDLILMDIQLPGMDGLEVTRRVKADPRLAGTPVIAVTANAQERDVVEAHEAGCVGYVTKPIRAAHFAAEIDAQLAAVGTPAIGAVPAAPAGPGVPIR